MTTRTDRLALIDLAKSLDAVRLQANAIEATAPQSGVYGDIATALVDVLRLIVGSKGVADQVYNALLDGLTVEQALRTVEGR